MENNALRKKGSEGNETRGPLPVASVARNLDFLRLK